MPGRRPYRKTIFSQRCRIQGTNSSVKLVSGAMRSQPTVNRDISLSIISTIGCLATIWESVQAPMVSSAIRIRVSSNGLAKRGSLPIISPVSYRDSRRLIRFYRRETLEFLLNSLRLVEGFCVDEYEARTGLGFSHISKQVESLCDQGLLTKENDRVRTSARGFNMLNSLISEFIEQ